MNVSNYASTSASIEHADRIRASLGGDFHYVIDTGRNGKGALFENGKHVWCNAPGRKVGAFSTTKTASENADAYIWIRDVGGSDGPCYGGPSAGTFWPDYAIDIARRSAMN